MKLTALRVDGFGRLAGRGFAFGPGLNVVVGPNEAGKSTLAAALVASLYGLQRGEKERWRPWIGPAYATALTYQTSDGAAWEVQRAFDKDGKGVRVYDADGGDAAARLGEGRSLSPGEAHLRISLDVFLQTACARQRTIALDGGSAGDVSSTLARALGGGPKEDAALGAIARLDEARRKHVGTDRAHKNVPLKRLRDLELQQGHAAAAARAALASLADLRERIAGARIAHDRDAAEAAQLMRRTRSLRAAHVRARLAALKEYRAELAALQTARATYDDVAAFAADRVAALDDAYHSWRSAAGVADAAAKNAHDEALDAAEAGELEERRRDAGSLDDDAFAALRAAAAQADVAHARSAAAAGEAAAARRDGDGGRNAGGLTVAAALVAGGADVGLAVAHLWLWTLLASAIAFAFGFAAATRARSRARRRRDAEAKQRLADAAFADERIAADAVAGVLARFGIATMDELVRRRTRFAALAMREAAAGKAAARARTATASAAAEAARFDGLADTLVPDAGGDRDVRRGAVLQRAARRRERDGLDARLAMLAMQRTNILHGEDDYTLQAEYDALVAEGAEAATDDDPNLLRELERRRAAVETRAREGERLIANLEGELRAGEDGVDDVAELDEALAATRAECARLDAFDRALKLARTTIDVRKDEAHRAFARRLEEYSAGLIETITGGRYGEIRLDPASLAIRVRIPETGTIEDLDRLSAGTRDQIALVVRFATARMFAEGFETPPLLLDDPFAFWDGDRIARCLPILLRGALDMQCIVFTASTELAAAADAAGANVIALAAPVGAAP